ncbi:uncharacterized protein BDW70DRAFT_165341 [Aspergillus foveolatus]|uniref:uncharacterized protein n=1 Tax=Aspergillus foveolatus TaxID=210207 RepID=UPI003CCCE17C
MIAALLYTPNEPHSYSYSVYIRPVESADPVISCSRRVPPDSDIGLGVAEAGFPFPAFTDTHRGGLFLDDAHANGGMVHPRLVSIDPTKPYMFLSVATCNSIATFFPVSFGTALGLYVWGVNSADYATIIYSPTYLSTLR